MAVKKAKNSKASKKKTLVIVESPSKAKTLTKLLGRGYEVKASVGHVRDLPKSRLAVDIENNFKPDYIVVRGKGQVVKELKKKASESSRIILASDPDREGEAIAWHLAEILGISAESPCRMRMYEITPKGVKEALGGLGPIDMNKVYAQQARRIMDRLVGYSISPILWRKIKWGLSAGRVQSAALKIVCDRERAIEDFVPQEYWNISVEAQKENGALYNLRVEKRGGKTLLKDGKTLLIDSEKVADEIIEVIVSNPLVVKDFTSKEGERKPPAPFKTSTLQQEAARRLKFSPRKTMSVAQELYEGVEIPGRGVMGLITYMRTDSLRVSPTAIEEVRSLISQTFGQNYLPKKPNSFESKVRSQDAHEAIRPTDVTLTPEQAKQYLSRDQYRLYELIWKRFVASQMSPSIVARVTLEAEAKDIGLKQSGVRVLFDGWSKVWPSDLQEEIVPEAVPGEELSVTNINKEQKFTNPPSRYTESGLIKVLEDKGIGRPSTYATILQTLSDRRYVGKDEEKKLKPTELGKLVNGFLEEYFPEIVDVGFTAKMEEELDEVESAERKWDQVVGEFWAAFEPTLRSAEENAEKLAAPQGEPIGENCPLCGAPLVKRFSRYGEFIGCSAFSDPEKKCTYSRPIVDKIGVTCPKCGKGDVVRRRGKRGRTFYGCSRYPECDYASWYEPTEERCPQCGGVVVLKGAKRNKVCSVCDWKEGKKDDGPNEE